MIVRFAAIVAVPVHTFRVLDEQIGLVPAAVARTSGAVDTAPRRSWTR
jgi:hypothetical protein